MNKVVIIGRNIKEIELKQTSSGVSAVEFTVAVKRAFKSANGEYDSDFFNCLAYRNTAELISRYVNKGDMVGIEGRLQTRNYTNKEGRKVYLTEIIVEHADFLQAKKQETEQEPEAPQWEEIDPFAKSDLPF